MNKFILPVASVAAVLLFVGAGCAQANFSDDSSIKTNDEKPLLQENTELKTDDSGIQVDDTFDEDTDDSSKTELNTNIKNETNTNIPTVKNDDSKKENVNEEDDEDDADEDDERPVSVTPSPTPTPTKPVTPTSPNPTAPAVKTYTMADVQAANNQDKCWSVISGKVYDLTPFTPNHPGGERAILSLCGKDGTSAFQRQHGGQSRPEATLSKYYLGVLKK